MLVLGNWINCAWFRPLTLNIQTNPEWLHYGEIVPGISLELVCAFRSRASCAAITETAAWRRTKSIEEKCLCTIFSYQVVFCPIGFLQYWSASIGPLSGILFQYLSWLVNSRWNVAIGGMGLAGKPFEDYFNQGKQTTCFLWKGFRHPWMRWLPHANSSPTSKRSKQDP